MFVKTTSKLPPRLSPLPLRRALRRRGDGGRQRRPEAVLAVQGCGLLRKGVPGFALEGWRAQGGVHGHLRRYVLKAFTDGGLGNGRKYHAVVCCLTLRDVML